MRRARLCLLGLLIPVTAGVLSPGGVIIRGRLTDVQSGAPLAGANVFLANTTLGTTTGKDGCFIISNAPFGSYDIVFSYVGYETEERSLSAYKSGELRYDISLKPKEISLSEVTVTGAVPEDWKENLEIFTRVFIGETDNAKSTRILNPEVLDFVRNKSENTLRAYSDSVIKIENNALGYILYVSLDSLVYDLPNAGVRYKIYPRFVELTPVDEKEESTWEKNRQKTYLLSPRHFFYALVHGQLGSDHYVLNTGASVNDILSGIQRRVFSDNLDVTTDRDSTLYTFSFPGVLKIDYVPNSPSLLVPTTPWVTIDKYGNLVGQAYPVEVYGYWSSQRIADFLPLNYIYKGN